jgi:hypothetical protein
MDVRRPPVVLALLVPFTGCLPNNSLEGRQLEAAVVEADFTVDPSLGPWEESGLLRVTGAEREWSLTLEGEEEAWALEVHSPAVTDLSRFADTALTLSVTPSATGAPSGLALSDDVDLVWALWGADRNEAVVDRFGDEFVYRMHNIHRSEEDGVERRWLSPVFPSDQGEVVIDAGGADDLWIDGLLWRVTVIAAYTERPLEEGATSKCGGGLLSFEIERVEAETGPVRLERPADAEMAARSCE